MDEVRDLEVLGRSEMALMGRTLEWEGNMLRRPVGLGLRTGRGPAGGVRGEEGEALRDGLFRSIGWGGGGGRGFSDSGNRSQLSSSDEVELKDGCGTGAEDWQTSAWEGALYSEFGVVGLVRVRRTSVVISGSSPASRPNA